MRDRDVSLREELTIAVEALNLDTLGRQRGPASETGGFGLAREDVVPADASVFVLLWRDGQRLFVTMTRES